MKMFKAIAKLFPKKVYTLTTIVGKIPSDMVNDGPNIFRNHIALDQVYVYVHHTKCEAKQPYLRALSQFNMDETRYRVYSTQAADGTEHLYVVDMDKAIVFYYIIAERTV